jgi:acetyl esterase
MHGGGWVFGGLDMTDRTCRAITNRAECVVVSVDYRLSPETKFPGALDDTYAALSWTADSAAELKIDERRIAVGGFSAGGNLAAAAALMARDRGQPVVALQLVVMPTTDCRVNTPSWDQFENGPIWTRADARWSWDHYLENPRDGEHPYASVLRAPDLRGLPPAILVTGGCDPLRDEGEEYAQRPRDSGVDAVTRRYEGMPHGFLNFSGLDDTRRALDEISADLRRRFA